MDMEVGTEEQQRETSLSECGKGGTLEQLLTETMMLGRERKWKEVFRTNKSCKEKNHTNRNRWNMVKTRPGI